MNIDEKLRKINELIKNEGADPSLELEDYERCKVCKELLPSVMVSGGVCAACDDVGGVSASMPEARKLEKLLILRKKLEEKLRV